MNIIADTHTHTIACDHAYSTFMENAAAAAEKGLKFLAVTEHTPSLPGAPTMLYFANMRVIPQTLHGVVILKGAEVNIINRDGAFDLADRQLDRLDWVIASMHTPTYPPESRADHTRAWLAVAENPLVDVIGHCGDSRYPFDEEEAVKAFAKGGKIVEVNAHSFAARPGSEQSCPRIVRLCLEYGVPVVVNSDAHFCSQVGCFDAAVSMLEEVGFPEEQVLNADYNRFLEAAIQRAAPSTGEFLRTLRK